MIYATINPAIVLQPLFFRIVNPVLNNYMPATLCESPSSSLSLMERKQIVISNPVDATLLFCMIDEHVKRHLFGVIIHEKVADIFTPGLLGSFNALTAAHEFTLTFSHHTHQMVILKLRAATCTKIAAIPTDNANFGKYLNSIITTYFPAGTEEEQLI